jgi:hypothetical protein
VPGASTASWGEESAADGTLSGASAGIMKCLSVQLDGEVPTADSGVRYLYGAGGGGGSGGVGNDIGPIGWGPSSNAVFTASGGGGGGGGLAFSFSRATDAGPRRAAAPVATWKRSPLAPNATRLRVGDTETLPLDAMEAAVRVDGARARVVLDCLYRNDRDRALEGTFELRLPDGASPFYFAFGENAASAPPATAPAAAQTAFLGTTTASARAVEPDGIAAARESAWTAPKEARMVPRERAAFAYVESTRRRVDPALLEWSGAGVFSARVFPLAPGKVQRVVLGYDVDLVAAGDDLELKFALPSHAPRRAMTLSVPADVDAVVAPAATARAESGRAVYSFVDPAQGEISLRLPHAGSTLLEGVDPAAGPCFAVSFRPDLPESAAAVGTDRAVFLVDTSLSSSPSRFPIWLKLLRETLERNRGTMREFAVLYFDVSTRWWRGGFVANTRGNVDAFLADADDVALEGATDLGAALAEAAAPSWEKPDAAGAFPPRDLFLFSDGAATWGACDPRELEARLAAGHAGALFAYSTGLAGTDGAALARLTRATGGSVVSVVGDAEIAAAATAHARRGFRVRGVRIEGGSDLLLAGCPTSVYPGQTLRLVGRGAPREGASVVLSLEQDGREFDVRATPTRVLSSNLAPRAYGQVAVGAIEEFAADAASPAKAYATHFRVVGSTCSLLMLESEADYERFGIHPEEDAARVRAEPASEFVGKRLAAATQETASPRAELLAWLRRLESAPGVSFRASKELLDAVERMPASSFGVDAPPLVCPVRRSAELPPELRDGAAWDGPLYDVVSAEARRRLADSPAEALRAMSSLVEREPGDGAVARDVAFSAVEWGMPGQAYALLRRVARSRPFEPETYRLLADCLAVAGNADLALVFEEVAYAGRWDGRFGDFHQIAAMDYARLLRRIARGGLKTSVPDFAAARSAVVEREVGKDAAGLVVVLTWNTDRTDVDLHVTDPRGEECFYQHPQTKIGGSLTKDVTQGFGPEMFVLPAPVAGDYVVRAVYFSSDRERASLRSKACATVYERWGTPQERVTRKVVVLQQGKDEVAIATVRIDE